MLPVRVFFWLLLRFLMSLRYRVRFEGLDAVAGRRGPFLILPNHISYSDPPIVIAWFWNRFRMRPLFLETNFQNPILAFLIGLLRPVKMPSLDNPSKEARERAIAAVQSMIDILKGGENIILWPSGMLTRDGFERIGGARTTADVLAAVPGCTVLRAKIRGLYGSSLSYAYTGHQPSMMKMMARGALWLLANLVVFGPRRHLVITVEPAEPAQRPAPTREAINPWLEAWYNTDSPETPTFRKYHWFLGPQSHDYPPPPKVATVDIDSIPNDIRRDVIVVVEEKLKRSLTPDEIRSETTFAALGLDSIDTMDVSLKVEQRYGFASPDVPTTLGGLWAVAAGLQSSAPLKPAPASWFQPPSDSSPVEIIGETIPEAFLNRALSHPRDVIAADDLSGVLTYERMLIGILTLSRRFRELPGDSVGLMLPASVAADVAYLALLCAGKLPVLLNWTTGPGNLQHAAQLTGLQHVVTSKRFIDRTHIEVAGTQYVFLEDLRASVGKLELLRHLLSVRLFPAGVRRRLLADVNPDPHRPCVVLFTSGSEKAPKAVPLTHANIIANQRAAVPLLLLTRADSLLGFLPMFHSFGLTVTSLFPLLSGIKVVYHPDPTDAAALVRKIAAYKPTITAATPTFLSFILERASKDDFTSLRIVATAAEKCPENVFQKARELATKATIIEGYGITECSPIVAINPITAPRSGSVGQVLPSLEACILDVDTHEPLPPGRMGMLHVSGPSIFPGYLGYDGPSPFREIRGKRFYITGDLAALSEDGYITFHGRMKRFLKAGGEMISLPALEEPLGLRYPATEKGPQVAVEGMERPDGTRTIALFTTTPITLVEANAILQDAGFRGVMRLDAVHRVDAIPVLGTGKTDYKALRALLK